MSATTDPHADLAALLATLTARAKGTPEAGPVQRVEQKIDWVWAELVAVNRQPPKDAVAAFVWRVEWNRLREVLALIATVTDDPEIERFARGALR